MTNYLKLSNLFGVILCLSVILSMTLGDSDDHEGTQGYGEKCLLAQPEHKMQCKSKRGLHCDALNDEHKCICQFEGSVFSTEKDSCVAKLGNICGVSNIRIPCEDPNAECSKDYKCECKQGAHCKSGGVPTLPGFKVLMTLAVVTGFTYMVL
jgi:hypothetical protein